jgi:hypothetical protein
MQGGKDRWGILLPGTKIEKVRFRVHFFVFISYLSGGFGCGSVSPRPSIPVAYGFQTLGPAK